MDRFSFFFAFYGLILGLAVTELLGGFRPAVLWLWDVPFKLALLGSYAGVWFARSRRANIAFLATSLLLFMIPYWQHGNITEAISRHYGY